MGTQQQMQQQKQFTGTAMNTDGNRLPLMLASLPDTIYKFLLELLLNIKYEKFISWTGNDWEFKINDPVRVSQLWMKRQKKTKMNYDILSRNIRYYYGKGIIERTHNKEYVYYFVLDLRTMLNITPSQLWKKYKLTPKPV